jgi:hypothetical protein
MRAGETEPRPFEVWLREDLRRRYGPPVREPVPDEWVRLLSDA